MINLTFLIKMSSVASLSCLHVCLLREMSLLSPVNDAYLVCSRVQGEDAIGWLRGVPNRLQCGAVEEQLALASVQDFEPLDLNCTCVL
jgi:hypothetical protein